MRWVAKWKTRSIVDGLPVTVRRAEFSSQEEQVKFLRRLVMAYRSTWGIIQLARDIVFRQSGCPPKRKDCHAIAIGSWVQRNILYINEGEELFQTPLHTLREKHGDCDDHTTLIASLCEAIGIPVDLVAVGWVGEALPFGKKASGAWLDVLRGVEYRHIFPRARISGPGPTRLLPLDSTLYAPVSELTDPLVLARAAGIPSPRTLVL